MEIAVNTDFLCSSGSPEPALRMIAEAGFTHLHWCHHWGDDFFYSPSEIRQYSHWMRELGLKLLDIHGASGQGGQEKSWRSPVEYQRQAGVDQVVNRIHMMHEMEASGSLILHVPAFHFHESREEHLLTEKKYDAVRKSLDDLMPVLEKYGVRIAVENGFSSEGADTFEILGALMEQYPEKYLGITYDSGHGNIGGAKGLDLLNPLKNRLQALHLNDNDGVLDQHQPPGMGTVDWEKMTGIIAESSYQDRPLSFELSMGFTPYYEKERKEKQQVENIRAFLADAYERSVKILRMTEDKRRRKAGD